MTQQPQWGQAPQWGQYGPGQTPPPGAGGPQPGYNQPGYNQSGHHQPGYSQPGYPPPGYNHYVAPPKPGVIPLRPLGLGEILDGAIQAARRNGKAMFGSALLFQVLTAVVTMAFLFLVIANIPFGELESGRTPSSQVMGSLVMGGSAGLVVTMLISVLGSMVLQGALVVPVSRAVLNRQTAFSSMWRLAKSRIGKLILLGLAYMLATMLVLAIVVGMIVLSAITLGPWSILIGIFLVLGVAVVAAWLSTKLLVAPAAMIMEDLGVIAALQRSWKLTTNNWWRIFGTYLLTQIIASVIGGIVSVPVSLIVGLVATLLNPHPDAAGVISQQIVTQGISAVVGSLVGAVTLAFTSGVLALIYVDLRMRKEGFDVVLMKENEDPNQANRDGIPGRPVTAASPPSPNNGWMSGRS